MADKKPKEKDEPKFVVKKRAPKEKPNFFQNIPSLKHPLAEILQFPAGETKAAEDLDDQRIKDATVLDAQTDSNLGVQQPVVLGDQINSNLGDQNLKSLDNQTNADWTTKTDNIGQPKANYLDDQQDNFGRPNENFLDDKTTKSRIRSTKKDENLDDKTTKNKNLDDQTSEKKINWKKYENARTTDRIGLRPNAEILRKFKVFCAGRDLNLTEFFEISGLKFIELDDQMQGSLVDKTTYDERRLMINWKTKARIINLYLRYNLFFNPNTKWKARDDEAGSAFNDVNIKIIELGIIQAQVNKFQSDPNGTINSFKFYTHEIANFERLGLNPETTDVMLEVNRKNWRNILGREIDLKFLEEE